MKGKLLVGLCVVLVLAVTAAVPAFAACTIDAPSAVNAGETIEIKVSGTTRGLSAIVATTGLQFVSVDGGMSDEHMVLLLGDIGTMVATYTYKVTAASGEGVSFALTDVTESDGTQDILEPSVTWSGMVGGAFTTTEEPRPSATAGNTNGSQTPAPTDTASASASPTVSAAETPVQTETPAAAATDGPKTGDNAADLWVLWIVAAVAAVVCVFAARKIYKTRKGAS